MNKAEKKDLFRSIVKALYWDVWYHERRNWEEFDDYEYERLKEKFTRFYDEIQEER
jgi:hypothetical protein